MLNNSKVLNDDIISRPKREIVDTNIILETTFLFENKNIYTLTAK